MIRGVFLKEHSSRNGVRPLYQVSDCPFHPDCQVITLIKIEGEWDPQRNMKIQSSGLVYVVCVTIRETANSQTDWGVQ